MPGSFYGAGVLVGQGVRVADRGVEKGVWVVLCGRVGLEVGIISRVGVVMKLWVGRMAGTGELLATGVSVARGPA